MLMEVENLSDVTLNELDTIDSSSTDLEGPASLLATGGSRINRLPYPFSHTTIDSGDTLELPLNFRDWRYKPVYGMPHEPGEEWAALVQAGTVALTFSSQTGVVDPEDLSLDTI